jgi:ABC-type molybdate transport system substrate-binding protein
MALIRLAIAASLFDAVKDAETLWQSTNSDTFVEVTEGSSGYLVDQIRNTGPNQIFPDIVIFAAPYPMADLMINSPGQGVGGVPFVTNSINYLGNSLVLIRNLVNTAVTDSIISFGQVDAAHTVNVVVGQNAPVTVKLRFADDTYSQPANPPIGFNVPAGRYSRAAFNYFGNANFAMAAPNLANMFSVRAVLNAVAGELQVPAIGAVYFTDTKLPAVRNSVEIIAIAPPSINTGIIYPIALINQLALPSGERNLDPAVNAFYTFLLSDQGKACFFNRGFLPIS